MKRQLILLLLTAGLMSIILLSSCNGNQGKTAYAKETIDSFFDRSCNCGLGSIVVPSTKADERRIRFVNIKKGTLDKVSDVIEKGKKEKDVLSINKVRQFGKFLNDSILLDSDVNGMRVYLGTRMKKVEEDKEDTIKEMEDGQESATMIFIFAPTIKNGSTTGADYGGKYYVHRNNAKRTGFHSVPLKRAKWWVQNFQKDTITGKRKALKSSLLAGAGYETKHIWFKKSKVKQLICQINSCTKNYPNIAGMMLRLVANTSQDTLPDRLSIDFVFVDSSGNEVDVSRTPTLQDIVWAAGKIIPSSRTALFAFYMKYQGEGFQKSEELFFNQFGKLYPGGIIALRKAIDRALSYDTGDPSPPPSTQELLDLYAY